MKYSLYFLYFISFIGIWSQAPQYINYLDYFIRIIISFVLIFYFNPFYKLKFTQFHKDIAFDAGVILFLSISLTSFINYISFFYENTYSIISKI
jgi:hypothetical protein